MIKNTLSLFSKILNDLMTNDFHVAGYDFEDKLEERIVLSGQSTRGQECCASEAVSFSWVVALTTPLFAFPSSASVF